MPFTAARHTELMSDFSVRAAQPPGASPTAEHLWNALYEARAETAVHSVAQLEDAAFRMYLPMARTLAHTVPAEDPSGLRSTEEVAEIGLAQAVLAWRQRSGDGFRRYARTAIMRRLLA